jgi:hypothetical protein
VSNEIEMSDEHVEVLALSRAMALIEIAADPAGAAKRVKELESATAALAAERSAAEKVVAEADARSAELVKGEASLTQRIADAQRWIDSSEKSFRERENRLRIGKKANPPESRLSLRRKPISPGAPARMTTPWPN